ncbi:MAG: prolyl oligopeptidase family serine peptidase [Euryarchaeota archaeon]|nr:prolyl oligopeptidase family serine peptidase [Euryarchaeota archaeon]
MKIHILICPIATLFFLSSCASTNIKSNTSIGQPPQAFERKITKTISGRYLRFLPKNYTKEKEHWPMILFLHGAGERGDDLELVKKHGPPKIVEEQEDFPFILVSPQCPKDEWWSMDVLNALLDEVVSRYRVDEDRIYLTGLSMGGFGAWHLAIEYPDRFAAIAPICGGGTPEEACKIRQIPVWVFHGARDETVPIEKSEEMVAALKECGGNVKFTMYPEAGHDSWTETYNNPELYDWFLKHRRKESIKRQ